MSTHTRADEITLWQMYIHSSVSAIAESPEAEGITIVRTSRGNEYRFPFIPGRSFLSEVVATLTGSGDTHILYLIHVWKNHWLDIPAYGLRQALTALCPENENALMMLIGEENFVIHSIKDTMI